MPDFSKVITLAYLRILGRLPDPGGLESFNRLMNASGLTEAMMRESLLRSSEYEQKNPGVPTTARGSARRPKGGRGRKARSHA
jgi:hypothetical protein